MQDDRLRNTLIAYLTVKSMLPELLGNQLWQTMGQEIEEIASELGKSIYSSQSSLKQSQALTLQLLEKLKPSDEAMKRIYLAMMTISELRRKAQIIFPQSKVDSQSDAFDAALLLVLTNDSRQETTRIIRLKKPGIYGAVSWKYRNLDLSIENLMKLTGGLITNTAGIVVNPPAYLVFGLLLLNITLFTDLMKEELFPVDTSVLHGVIIAFEQIGKTDEQSIFEWTNKEREEISLPKLTDGEIRAALLRLEDIETLELIDGEYRIIETVIS